MTKDEHDLEKMSLLSHLIEFNHSKNFWNLVDKLITNRLDAQKWLKQNDNYMYRLRLD